MKLVLPLTVALARTAALLQARGTATVPVPHARPRVYVLRIGGAAGTLAGDLGFRNRSAHTCFVFGYPGLGLEDRFHRLLPTRVTWGSTPARRDRRPHRVVLSPRRAAFANLSWSDVQVRSERCVQPNWLEVTPPDEFTHRLVPFKAPVCSHGHLTVTALSRTRTPR